MLKKLLVAILCLAAGAALAQTSTTASLSGTVTHEGAGLPGVTITIKSPALQGSRSTVTGAGGGYSMLNLPPGEYTVTFAIGGFETVSRGTTLKVAQRTIENAELKFKGVTESVVVTAAVKDIISETAQAATTVPAKEMAKLPTARTILQAVQLAPGVNTNGPNNNTMIAGAMSFDNLFTINGVVATENIRGTPYDLYIEDAVLETTTSVSSISAEYGRFTGGVVNAVTKSGSNEFSGSFRATVTNDAWSAISPTLALRDSNYKPQTPVPQTRTQDALPRYEATLGGPIWKDHIWFFLAGRYEKTSATQQTRLTQLDYVFGQTEKRLEAKLTLTPIEGHTLVGAYTTISNEQTNYAFPSIPVMDMASIYDRQLPQELLAINYAGVFTNDFTGELQYSSRKFTFENSGSRYTDLILGTVARDRSQGTAWWSPIFCGICGPEERNNNDYLVKLSYFLSTEKLGQHQLAAGYDNFGGQRLSNNHQSGSDYQVFGTGSTIRNGVVYPVWRPGSTILLWYPIPYLSQGSDVRTQSVYLNDNWRLNNHFTFNIGLRWDKNHAVDSYGALTANDSAWSPRLSAAYDPKGDGGLIFRASYGKYVGAPSENQVSAGSPAGNPATFQYIYQGPAINGDPNAPTLVPTDVALQQFFNYWGITAPNQYPAPNFSPAAVSYPGVNTKIVGSLKSPSTDEFTVGFQARIARWFNLRVDGVYRKYMDFYNERVDMSTGYVTDSLGRKYDFRAIENTNDAERKYYGLHTGFEARPMPALSFGGSWTWSHLYGNFIGETSGSGPVRYTGGQYPEYIQIAWNVPTGSLSADQRHRLKVWGTYDLPLPKFVGTWNVGAIWSLDTGLPYGAAGTINSTPYVTNPGYYQPPTAGVTYWFTARDAFRTPTVTRLDMSLNWTMPIFKTIEIFISPQVYNVFNSATVTGVDQTVVTAASPGGSGNTFVAFNPFTTAPVQRPNGDQTVKTANWDYGPNFGNPTAYGSYQLPRTFRISCGIRF